MATVKIDEMGKLLKVCVNILAKEHIFVVIFQIFVNNITMMRVINVTLAWKVQMTSYHILVRPSNSFRHIIWYFPKPGATFGFPGLDTESGRETIHDVELIEYGNDYDAA
ncbi:hypothetical protein K501DRAFT_278108 [Backusella circina FSU 941]|nr:hypothetical protein K501DRAFT_278108 [Backusella circina FSU 941]